MKVTRSGTIEPCCEWIRLWVRYFEVDGYTVIMTDVSGNYPFGNFPVSYCPFCGAKTEASKK